MNSAIAVSSPLQRGLEQPAATPAAEHGVGLGRSLLLIPLLAAAAWAVLIAVVWMAWHLLT